MIQYTAEAPGGSESWVFAVSIRLIDGSYSLMLSVDPFQSRLVQRFIDNEICGLWELPGPVWNPGVLESGRLGL